MQDYVHITSPLRLTSLDVCSEWSDCQRWFGDGLYLSSSERKTNPFDPVILLILDGLIVSGSRSREHHMVISEPGIISPGLGCERVPSIPWVGHVGTPYSMISVCHARRLFIRLAFIFRANFEVCPSK